MSENKKARISISITEPKNSNFIVIEPKRTESNFNKKPRNIRILIRKNPYSLIIYKNGLKILEESLSE